MCLRVTCCGCFQLTVLECKHCFTLICKSRFLYYYVMLTKTYSCSDFLYAKMKVPELQGREGLVSRRSRSLAALTLCLYNTGRSLCYINKRLVLKADLEESEMRLFRPETHLHLPVMDSQSNCVFAQLTGRQVLHMLRDLHQSIQNVDTCSHLEQMSHD